jgi:acetyl-CoA synthetase
MKVQLIKKKAADLASPPNLENYEKTARNFNWNSVKGEIEYQRGGQLNAAYNVIERHAKGERRYKLALLWVGAEGEEKRFTFEDLDQHSNRFANVLTKLKLKPQERIFFFLSRVPEMYFGFLGSLKANLIAGTMFSAFGEQAIKDRLDNSSARVVVTEPDLLPRLQKVLKDLHNLKYILVVENGKKWRKPTIRGKKFYSLNELLEKADSNYKTKFVEPETPAFMLYTSGTTGKPKGVIHTHQAILQQHMTSKWVLDLKDEDMYWCTADPGWVTGISYTIMGPWSLGATSLVYNGRFTPEDWYRIIEKYKVNVWYTAPTAVRMLAASGLDPVRKFDLSSLRHILSVGEPLNPDPIRWGIKAFGLPFHDTWWQTETGAMMIANYPSMDMKVGSMGKPIPGVIAGIVDDNGRKVATGKEGNLAIKPGWPSQMSKIWRRPNKYKSYFVNGWYLSGDHAWRDRDGYYWFIGRADDVIKTSGERVGPFEVESALVDHPDVTEAAVIGKPDALRGEIIKAFVKLSPGVKGTEALVGTIQKYVKQHLAGHAYPREIEFVTKLPKTRSGKIMRRLLKARELGLPTGDTSTLEEY